ncbi:hypothetical protein CALVIDRAFT_532158 [Calocera viscosa TUFC12733]|uniref:Uncharacterized protein n=1 Tax=Calocera viscosa (strain TUFC12733) TaxID=1330018 RepID=A0A167RY43_CALVF|nr:hypothetical protein CALVIDRAFT_532158 [Calocera viscosa TUFC12733]
MMLAGETLSNFKVQPPSGARAQGRSCSARLCRRSLSSPVSSPSPSPVAPQRNAPHPVVASLLPFPPPRSTLPYSLF